MQVPLSVLLTRAKRQKKAVPFLSLTTPEIAVAACNSLVKTESSAVLVVDFGAENSLEPEILLRFVSSLSINSKGDVAVMARIEPQVSLVEEVIVQGATAIVFSEYEFARRSNIELTEWVVGHAAKNGVEMMGAIYGLASMNRIEKFIHQTGVQSISIPISPDDSEEKINLDYLKEICSSAKIPVVGQDFEFNPKIVRGIVRSGVVGYMVDDDELSQAYTAGLRTALRNRTLYKPAIYHKLAIKAVEQEVHSICNMI